MLGKIKMWANKLKRDIVAVYIASTDVRTPRLARLLAIAVAAYAFSPIDLIPDFIPVLGMLDDLIIVPAGIALFVRLVPQELLRIYRIEAETRINPASNRKAAILIVVLWVVLTTIAIRYILA